MIRTAPQRSHVSRCPPRTAVRQVAIARSARCWTVREAVRSTIRRRHGRARCPRAPVEDGCATAVPDRHGAHGLALRRRRETREQIERRVRADLRVPGQVEIPGRGRDVAVAEQPLNRVDVDTGFQQVRRKGVAQSVNPAGLRDPRATFRGLIGPLQTGRMHRPVAALRRETARAVGR